jgi:hypothetical protein
VLRDIGTTNQNHQVLLIRITCCTAGLRSFPRMPFTSTSSFIVHRHNTGSLSGGTSVPSTNQVTHICILLVVNQSTYTIHHTC